MKKSNFLIPLIITLLVSSATFAEEHLPVSGKSYTIGNGSATDWTHKYETLSFAGIPDKLSFNFAYIYTVQAKIGNPTLSYDQLSDLAKWFLGSVADSKRGHGNEHMLYVEESADGTNWTTIWTDDDATSKDTRSSGSIQLQKSTRHIRFHHSCNFSNSYTNIAITELKYLEEPDPATIDFGTAVLNSGEVKKTTLLNWCNITPLTVTCSNPRFTVTPTSFGNIDEYGSQVLTVAYTHTDEAGSNEADITISNGTYTKNIYVSATTTKRQQAITWNSDLAATGFAMNVGEQYPDEGQVPVLAVATGGGHITFTSENENIIAVIADTALLAKGIGSVHITAHQAGDDEYEEISDTKSFVVTPLQKQAISWEQNLYGLLTTSEPVELTATATSGGEITYTSADETVVTVSGNILTVVGEGETYITATQAGFTDGNGIEWLAVSQNNYVVVRNPASQCNGLSLSQSSLTLNSSKKSQDYTLSGIPNTLTFTAKHGTKSTSSWGSATYSALIVEQYAYINNLWDWYQVYNQVVGTSDTQSGTISLNETATKLRFRTLETGTDHTISNIRVTRQKFMRTDVDAIDEDVEAKALWSKTITIGHSNIDLMTVTSKQQLMTVSTSMLGEGCDDFGDDDFTVSFTPAEKYVDYYDTLVITDNKTVATTIEIPVHLYSLGLHQMINGFELPESCFVADELDPFTATATSGLEVVYLSSDSTIAYVENNRLVILSGGTVSITAHQAGDARYESVSETKTIVIQRMPTTVIEAPQAKPIAIGQSLADAKLIGGVASVEGSFAWQDPTIVPEIGTHTYTVIFTPENKAYYAAAETQVEVLVTEEKYTQEITWEDDIPQLYVGQTFQLTATASSGLDVLFISSDETVAYVDADNVLITLAEGDITLTATQAGNEVYNEAEPVIRELTILTPPTTYSMYESTFCEGDSVEFRGVWYFADAQEEIPLEEKNIFGGDSVIQLSITTTPVYLKEDSMTVRVGWTDVWQNIAVGQLPEGDTTLVAHYATVNGCDSTHVLYLTVLPKIVTYSHDTVHLCSGERYVFEGKTYRRPTTDSVRVSQRNQYGCDSIVVLVIQVSPIMRVTTSKTINEGDEETWQDIDLSFMPAGDTTLVAKYISIHGCDSVYVLNLTVLPQLITSYQTLTDDNTIAEKVIVNGQLFIRKGEAWYDLFGRKVD